MQVHKCNIHDLHQLTQFNKRLIEDEQSDNTMNEAELYQRMQTFITTEYDAYFFIEKESIIGYALVKNTSSPLYLRQFYIDRQFRRMHYGEKAFHELLAYLRISTIDIEVLTWNERAIRFWEKLNFKERSKYMRYNG